MGRVFKDCLEMIKEIDRDLKVCGITVPVKHYQNKKLLGDDKLTKELIGVSFIVSKPLLRRYDMLEFIFKKDADRIEDYCKQEHKDRVSRKVLNPGNSWKIRQDMWQKFMIESESKFDYTYSERLYFQLDKVIEALEEDHNTRQAVLQVFQSRIDCEKFGGDTRIPCSMDYQILIRNDKLNLIYHMRSNDYFGHFPIDVWLAAELMDWFVNQLKGDYQKLSTGSLTYFCGSLHAYRWNLDQWVIY